MRGNSLGTKDELEIRFQRIQAQPGIKVNSARFFVEGCKSSRCMLVVLWCV